MAKRLNRSHSITLLAVAALILALFSLSAYAANDKAKESFNQGVTASKAGKVDDAITAYKAAIAADADYFDAYMNLGALYFQKAQYDDALKMFQTAAEKNPKAVDAFANIGRVQAKKRAWIEAETAYKSAIGLDDKDAKLVKELAGVYYANQNWSSLVQTSDKIISMNAADDQTYFWLGKGNEKQGKNTEALAAYNKSIELKPKNYAANYAVGQMYLQQTKYQEAAKAFKAALVADPKGSLAAYNYAYAMESLNSDATAQNIANWQEFVKIGKFDPKRKGEVAQAEQHIKELQAAVKK